MALSPAAAASSQPADSQQGQQDDPFAGDFDVQRYVNRMFPTGGWRAGSWLVAAAAAAAAVLRWQQRHGTRLQAPCLLACVPVSLPAHHTHVFHYAEASLMELDPLVGTLRQKVEAGSVLCVRVEGGLASCIV